MPIVTREKNNPEIDQNVIQSLSPIDKLRYIECLCSDKVRDVYDTSQDILPRDGLDARNVVDIGLPTIFEMISAKFDDASFS